MSAQILNDRRGHQQQALLISRGRSSAKSATTGGESSSAGGAAAHNLYPQGGESLSAGGAPALNVHLEGASELISSRRSSTQSPATGGERVHLIAPAPKHPISTHRRRKSSSAARAPAPNVHPEGARELISSTRSSAKCQPRGGERAHQQHALQHQIQHQILTHRGRKSSSARGAPAPNVHPEVARELISSTRSSTKSQPTGGERAHKQHAFQHPISTQRGRESSSGEPPVPNVHPEGARELISSTRSTQSPPTGGRELISRRRSSAKCPPRGGERAHQQQALQHPISTHRGRESSSAGGAPAP